jgi:hypothetical protein
MKMKKYIFLVIVVIAALLLTVGVVYWQTKDNLSEEQLAVKRMRDIHMGLCIYKDEYGVFPPSLKNLESTYILYKEIDYSEYIKNTRYIYFNDKENLSYDFTSAPRYSSPEPTYMKVWFYYPLKDGNSVVAFGPAVTVGYLHKAKEGEKKVEQEEYHPHWHLDRTFDKRK